MLRFTLGVLVLAFVLTPVRAQAQEAKAAEQVQPKQSIGMRAWEMLSSQAVDGKEEKRMDAIAALGTMGRQARAVKLVEAALQDKDRDVRQMAAATLGEMGGRRSVAALRKALDDEAPEVVFAAARSLWQLGDRSGRGILEEVLLGERAASRGAVSSNLEKIGKILTNPKGLVLFGLREGIGAVAGPYAMGMNVVQEFTKDRSVAARVVCANMLAAERGRRALPVLRDALYDENWVVRLTAAKGLGRLGNRAAVKDLATKFDDEDEKQAVKLMIAAAILNLGAK